MKAIILAAGMGSRLGNSDPKPLTKLKNGESILQRQVNSLSEYIGIDNILVIVGYKKDLIMEFFPNLLYVYNNYYDTTNTSKSLLSGLKKIQNENVIWLNGDVVFEKELLPQIFNSPHSCVAVNTNKVGEEEVKYNIFPDKSINEISKEVKQPMGEAVGINKITASDIPRFIINLEKCNDQDYFEKAMEYSIQDGMKIFAEDISKYLCFEIDFIDDLNKINDRL